MKARRVQQKSNAKRKGETVGGLNWGRKASIHPTQRVLRMPSSSFLEDWKDIDLETKSEEEILSAIPNATLSNERKSPEKKSLHRRMSTSLGFGNHNPNHRLAHAESYWQITGGIHDTIQLGIRDRKVLYSRLDQAFLVLPHSSFRMAWDLNMLVFLSYVAAFTPFQMAFLGEKHDMESPQTWPVFFALDRLIDLVFLVDIFINFRSAWVEEDGSSVVFDQKVATQRYLHGWFTLDLISLLPWEVLALIIPIDGGAMLRFPKLLKLLRLIKILKLVRASRVVRRVEQNLGVKYGLVRLGKFAIMLVIIAHWLACSLMFVSTLDDNDADEDVEGCVAYLSDDGPNIGKWRWRLYCECECSTAQLYVSALYWSTMTLTTIGYGDVGPANATEMFFIVVAMLVGAAVFSFVVGTCCTLVEGLDKLGLSFQEEFDSINDYLQICDVSVEMRRRVRAYVWNCRSMSNRRNESHILSLMSPALQKEFMIHNHGSLIRKVPSLKGAPDTFIIEMAKVASRRLYGPRDTITYQFTINESFYCLTKGEVVLLRTYSPHTPVSLYKRLKSDGHWNLRLLIYDSYSICSTKATTFVEVVAFDSDILRRVLRSFPNGYACVKKAVIKELLKFACSRPSVKYLKSVLKHPGIQQEVKQGAVEKSGSILEDEGATNLADTEMSEDGDWGVSDEG